jgi:hypothetical protein
VLDEWRVIDSARTGVQMQHAIDGRIWNKPTSGRVNVTLMPLSHLHQ